jgi:hypothetical protein
VAPYLALGLTFVTTVFLAAWYLRGQLSDMKVELLKAIGLQDTGLSVLRAEHQALEKRVGTLENKVNQ